DEAVADRNYVHALVLDSLARRRDLDSAAPHRPLVRAAGRPFLDDEVLADVLPAAPEAEVGKHGEDAADRGADLFAPDVDVAGHVVLEDRVIGMHGEDRFDDVRVEGLVRACDEIIDLRTPHGDTAR